MTVHRAPRHIPQPHSPRSHRRARRDNPARRDQVRDRVRPPRPRPAVRALDRGARLRAVVGGREARGLRAALGGVERAAQPRPLELGRRRPGGARVRRRQGRDRALPLQHLHGHAAGGDRRRRRGRVRRLQPRRPLHVLRGLRGEGRAPQARAAILVHIGGHIAFDSERIAAYCRDNGIFLLEDCAHAHGADWNGAKPGRLRRRRRLLALRDQDGLDRRGRRARLRQRRADRVRPQVPQLRQVRARGRRPQLPDERVHRRPRPGPGRADGGDRRLEERVRPRAPRPGPPGAARAARGDDLRPLQVHRLRRDREDHRPRLRPALPPHHGPLRRAAEHRLGGREPLVRAALLPPREPRGGARTKEGGHEGPGHRRRGLHRLPRRRSPARPRHHAAHLRPQRLALPLAAGGRDLHRQHHRPGQPRPGDARLRRRHPPRRGRRRRPRPRRPGPGRGGQHPRHPQRARGRLPAPRSAASSTARPPGSTATASSRTSTRRRRSRRRATSTPRPSSPARPTAPATPSSTTSRAPSCASASPTAPAPAPPASSPSSPTSPSKARR